MLSTDAVAGAQQLKKLQRLRRFLFGQQIDLKIEVGASVSLATGAILTHPDD
jgi:hypothetical protein